MGMIGGGFIIVIMMIMYSVSLQAMIQMWSVNLLKLREWWDTTNGKDFETTGRWKTICKGNSCDLYIEIVEQINISIHWWQFKNIQPVLRWISEDSFIEVKTVVETINECNKYI